MHACLKALGATSMFKWGNSAQKPKTSVREARNILGTTGEGLSDEAIVKLVMQVEVLTDIVVAHAYDSNIQSLLDISNRTIHTGY